MNAKTLKKAVDELAKETPNIAYVRGMLETMLDASSDSVGTTNSSPVPKVAPIDPAVAGMFGNLKKFDNPIG